MVNRDQVSRFHHLQNLEGSPRAGHQDLLSDPPLPWIDQPQKYFEGCFSDSPRNRFKMECWHGANGDDDAD